MIATDDFRLIVLIFYFIEMKIYVVSNLKFTLFDLLVLKVTTIIYFALDRKLPYCMPHVK